MFICCCLYQGKRFEKFIHGTKAAGKNDRGHGIADKHEFANKEVTKIEADALKRIGMLLAGELNIEPDRGAASLNASTVSSFHDAGPAAGDNG